MNHLTDAVLLFLAQTQFVCHLVMCKRFHSFLLKNEFLKPIPLRDRECISDYVDDLL